MKNRTKRIGIRLLAVVGMLGAEWGVITAMLALADTIANTNGPTRLPLFVGLGVATAAMLTIIALIGAVILIADEDMFTGSKAHLLEDGE